ncbi:MAG TPA: SpoIIE family protein phosphatase [Solirubrobacteraceae bacterium]|nr:SpoIIE family protein phosphatase [Solirubrobacteraceae bacterium]
MDDATHRRDRLRAALAQVPALVALFAAPDLRIELVSAASVEGAGDAEAALLGRTATDVAAGAADPRVAGYAQLLERVLATGESVHRSETPVRLPGAAADSFWDVALVPLRDPAGAVDGVLLHAVEVTRLVEARHRFTTLLGSSAVGVTITGEDELLEANDAFLAMVGRTRAELEAGLSWRALTAPESAAEDERAMAALRGPGSAPAYEKEYLRPDGGRVPVLLSGTRLRSEPLEVLATVFDLTERRAAEREIASLLERERAARRAAEQATARTARLQAVTAGLSASNSATGIARAIVHHALEELSASERTSSPLDAESPLLQHAAGLPRGRVEQWRQFPGTLPPAVGAAIRDAAPVPLHPADAAAELGAAAALAVPLLAGDRVLGALLVGFRDERSLEGADLDFLIALASHGAVALDRVRLYENRAYVARKLQEGLLPQRLADVDGADVAVVYESISGGGEVGGDFYDVFEVGPRRWAVAVGDVCGKGTDAAVVTGLARHTVRAVARMRDEPAGILGFLNAALRAHAGPPSFCTVGCALLEPASGGGFAVRLSSGGHPYPFVVRGDGALEEVEVTGTMLGVADEPELEEVRVDLGPGDALVLYTDGVADAREAGGERFGEERLRSALARAAGGSAGEQAAAVEAAVRAHAPGPPADDRAVVVVRALPR